MNEANDILSGFEERFGFLKGRNTALCPGVYREEVIRRFGHAFRFVRMSGTEIPEETAAVIVTELPGETDIAALRENCTRRGIALLDLFGLDLNALYRELEGHGYLKIARWKSLLEEYDVISLIAPAIAVKCLKMEGRWVLRRRFRIMYEWLKQQGKEVVLFYDDEGQTVTLAEEGIQAGLYERKGYDLGYAEIAGKYAGRRIIHIGVDTVKDGIMPREYGLDSRLSRGFVFDGTLTAPADRDYLCADRVALITAIDSHDIISFDIFDTLIKRTVMYPKDVFEMVEERTGIRGYADCRYEIQTTVPQSSLPEIYAYLKGKLNCSDEVLERLCSEELRTEQAVILPRMAMVDIFEYAKARGKTVVLLSDMYLSADFMHELLEKNGITGYDAMYLSYMYRKLKYEGLFEELSGLRKNGETVLHIGDNYFADCVSARKYGIDAWYVPGCLEMAEKNGYADIIAGCRTLAERKVLGLAVARGFDDPFARRDDLQIADMILAPLVAGYLQWVCSEMSGRGYDRFLLFSRDGWILRKPYERLRRMYPDRLPPCSYIYTSRHAAYLTIMDDFPMARYFFDMTKFRDDPPGLLRKIFCLPADEILPYHGESVEAYYRMHEDVIRRTAERFRRNYRRYLEEEGIPGKKCAVMDFVSEGGSQMMLEKYVAEKTDGYYIGIPEYVFKYAGNIRYYLDHDLLDYNTEMKLEVYFTSMEPAADHIGDDGKPVFAPETRSPRTMDRIRHIQDRVTEDLDLYLDHLHDPQDTVGKELIFQLCTHINDYQADNEYYDDMSGQRIVRDHTDERDPG